MDNSNRGSGGTNGSSNGSLARIRWTLSWFLLPFSFGGMVWAFVVDYLGHPITTGTAQLFLGMLALMLALLGVSIYRQGGK